MYKIKQKTHGVINDNLRYRKANEYLIVILLYISISS